LQRKNLKIKDMATNEETIYQSNAQVGNSQKSKENVSNKKSSWKPVIIGGTAGILVGAGAMFATEAYATGDEPTASATNAASAHSATTTPDTSAQHEVKVAEVDDNQSFKDAFDAARNEVGPGGVFQWHNGIYNTYSKDEWDSMSDDNKDMFAQQVKPEVQALEVDTSKISEDTPEAQPVSETTPGDSGDVNIVTASDSSTNDDVHFVGSQEVQLTDGSVVTESAYIVQGHNAVVIDVDNNGDPDVGVVDVNDNHVADVGEVFDMHTGGVITVGEATNGLENTGYPGGDEPTQENPDPTPDAPNYDNPGCENTEDPNMHIAANMSDDGANPDFVDNADTNGIA
jgi:hypothetical protein